MFDITKEIRLEPHLQKKYAIARVVLYLAFLLGALYVAYRILLPSVSLIFSFNNANSLKNTLVSPRTANENLPTKGNVPANDKLLFNANPLGNFSDATISFTLDENSKNIENDVVKIRKSYQAFFYPISEPVGFKNGTLLVTGDNDYYMVSGETLRKFSSPGILLQLGYSKNPTLSVSQNDLRYNKKGPEIIDADSYPEDTLFLIDDAYYQLKNGQLSPFVSARAFLSQFEDSQAITKNVDFLENYPVSEKLIGFANGTLVSSNQSVFILSEGKSYPIESADTFNQMGFDWNDVVAVDSGELETYEKQKQFTHNQPHPDGTLFIDQKTNEYFLIKDGEKHPVKSAAIAKTYSKQNPVVADLQTSNQSLSCQLKKKFSVLNPDMYACDIFLGSLGSFIGNDYQIETSFSNDVKITNIDTTFSTPLTWQNIRASLSRIKTNLKSNYSQ